MSYKASIQDRIVLGKICKRLAKENLTRTYLRRYIGPTELAVNSAIDYGLNIGAIKSERQGYVSILNGIDEPIEENYYDCIEIMISDYYKSYVSDKGQYLTSRTARKNSKIAGRWTRPDFTVILNRKFEYINQPEFDIITFEVKRPEDCEVLAVFEALAHNSSATRSYVFFPITELEFDKNIQADRIREECTRHGIGLILVEDSFNLDKSRIMVESQRRPLNPEKCSHFLRSVLEADDLAKLTTW